MRAIIIEDEAKARNVLKTIVLENCNEYVSEIFEAKNLLSGVELIRKHSPEIVFLDIEMPEHSGLEILDFLEPKEIKFQIIFTTAYSEYAIQAFQLSAIDYILKPVRPTQIKNAVQKVAEKINNSEISLKLVELKRALESNKFCKIGLPNSSGIKFVNFHEILLMEADGMYTKVFLINDEIILVSKPLRHFLEILSKIKIFYKPHRSYIINLKYLKEYIKNDGGYIVIENGKSVPISKDKKKEFMQIVSSI